MEGKVLERFMKKIQITDGCWLWQAAKTQAGYGQCGDGKKSTPAHRASYEHFVGPIPEGMQVCHKCHVRACVRPDHLYVDTPSNNVYEGKRAYFKTSLPDNM